jgi:putative endonuclease
VRCRDGSFYTGYARDPIARAEAHNSGKGARYTCSRRPVRLVYVEPCESLGHALSREYAIKSLTRTQKAALVASQRRAHHRR